MVFLANTLSTPVCIYRNRTIYVIRWHLLDFIMPILLTNSTRFSHFTFLKPFQSISVRYILAKQNAVSVVQAALEALLPSFHHTRNSHVADLRRGL
jgi:hypothetical protein